MVSNFSNTIKEEDGKVKKEVATEVSKLLQGQPGYERMGTESISIEQSLILNGWGFFIDYKINGLTNGAKKYLEFTSPINRKVALVNRTIKTDKEKVNYKVHINYSGITPSTPVVLRKLRTDEANTNTPDVVITEVTGTPTLTGLELDVVTDITVNGQVNSGNRASGDLEKDEIYRLFGDGTKFLIELESESVDPVDIELLLVWGEIPNELVRPPVII